MVLDLPVEPDGEVDSLYAPRRTVLDPMLAAAAREAGADVRFETPVTGVLRDELGRVVGVTYRSADGREVEARASITIGADGARSMVAREVGAPLTRVGANASAVVYAYFDAPELDGFRWFFRDGAGAGVIPTNGGALVYVAVPPTRFEADVRSDVEVGFWEVLWRHAPEAAELVTPVDRTSRFHVHAGMAGFHRRPYGPGWALVGDASHFKDPISAHGLTDALRDAELLARALDPVIGQPGAQLLALAGYRTERDRLATPLFDISDEVAAFDWTPDEARTLLIAMSRCLGEEVQEIRAFDAQAPARAA
jgi:flavin-dependent dehydrogenase